MTKIEWADETWNPVVGCSAASDGCTNCYAHPHMFMVLTKRPLRLLIMAIYAAAANGGGR